MPDEQVKPLTAWDVVKAFGVAAVIASLIVIAISVVDYLIK